MEKATNFKDELVALINRFSKENGSDTPDFLLGEYLDRALNNYDKTVVDRESWYGRWRKGEPDAIAIISEERREQLEKHGYNIQHDDLHMHGELASAAACYAIPEGQHPHHSLNRMEHWPWEDEHWKPSPEDRIKELAKAGALIAAELERHLRIQRKDSGLERAEL